MNDLQRDHPTAQDNPYLEGLRQAPLAILVAGVALKRAGWLGLNEINLVVFGIVLFIVMAMLWVGIGWVYARAFGLVVPPADQGRKAVTALLLIILYALFLIVELGGRSALQVSLSGMFVGFLFVGLGRTTRRGYDVLFGALLVAEGLLPLLSGKPIIDPVFGTLGALYGLTFGAGLLAISLVDHFRLVREKRTQAARLP
jgi:hypothetical protein